MHKRKRIQGYTDLGAVRVPPIPGLVLGNQGLQFDGINDSVEVADYPNLTGAITIEALILIAALPPTLASRIVVKDDESSDGSWGFSVRDTGTLRFFCRGPGGHQQGSSIGPLIEGKAYWVAVSYSTDTQAIRLYVEGKPAEMLQETIGLTAPAQLGVPGNAEPVGFGARTDDPSRYLGGFMYEVRIWNAVRSPAQVIAFTNARLNGNETDLVGLWRLDEGTGLVAADSGPLNKPATLMGATWSLRK